MASGSGERADWDEAAALEELERVHRGIEEWRRRRKDVQAEFDRFVRGFRRTGQEPEIASSRAPEKSTIPPPLSVPVSGSVRPTAAATSSPAATPSATPIAAAPAPASIDPAAPVLASDGGLAPAPSAATVPHKPPSSPTTALAPGLNAWLAKQSTQRSRVIAGGGALVLVLVAGALLTRHEQSQPDGPTPSGSPPVSASTPAVSEPAVRPAAQQTAPPVEPGPPRSEIVALRRVWVRVVVDGSREVERELDAGERVPLRAGRTSVVRAGNAGAVRVTINGEDRGTLGPEGEPMTRTLRAPATPAR